MNVHKRCHKNVTNNCGINSKKFGEVLGELGISSESLSSISKSKKNKIPMNEQSPSKSSFNERSHTSPLPNMTMDQLYSEEPFCNAMSNMRLSLITSKKNPIIFRNSRCNNYSSSIL